MLKHLAALAAPLLILAAAPAEAGDDWTDEAAFAAANRLGGRSLRIGPADRPTAATEAMASPEALRAWLAAQAG